MGSASVDRTRRAKRIPPAGRDQAVVQVIIGMEPQHIVIGMPAPHIAIIFLQQSMNMSIDMPSIGVILQVMPSEPISQVISAIMTGIGIMPPIIGIMPFVIGMPIIIGIGIGMFIIGCICMAGIIAFVLGLGSVAASAPIEI